MLSKRQVLNLIALITPLLAGGQCVFVASSGGNDSCKPSQTKSCGSPDNTAPVIVVAVEDGQFIDAPVMGLRYESGSLSGTTGSHGEFRYESGSTIRFFIGDIPLGEAVRGKAVITPLDLIPNGTIDTVSVVNIARLLQSLDAEPGDNRITIPAALHSAAVLSNNEVAAAIQNIDYADDSAFVNSATQLVSTLTSSYPFTATLVDEQSAQIHLARQLHDADLSTTR